MRVEYLKKIPSHVMEIALFATGGTFDKEYDLIKGELFFRETHLSEMLKMGRCTVPIVVRTLMMMDSLNMTDAERDMIVTSCKTCDQNNIVITHGTDTMVKTAEALANADVQKTIVLTGAMIPYKFGSSDGFFNLGNALAFAQSLAPGVYIAMNGRAFDWDKVKKNAETGVFEELA